MRTRETDRLPEREEGTLKIGFITQPGHAVLPPTGSLEIWTREVARRLVERGHEVTIYASVDGVDQTHGGVEYRFVEHDADRRIARWVRPFFRLLPSNRAFFSSGAYQLLYWRRAARLAANDCRDVIHVYNYSQALPFVRKACPRAVVALHMQCEWLTQLAREMLSRRLRNADLVIGCSEYITQKIVARFPEHAHRTATVYNGVDSLEARAAGHERDDRGVRLLHVGRISPEKGHHILARAFNRLVERHPTISLTLVGEESPIPVQMALDLFGEEEVEELRTFYAGSYLEHIRAELSEKARPRVRFTGRISYEHAAAAYRDADIFVFPSIFEAFPIPPIEAMAAGLPVVASAVGGTAESVRDSETGILVRRGDVDALTAALERLIVDPALRREFANAGRVRAAELFSWETVCDSFVANALVARARLAT